MKLKQSDIISIAFIAILGIVASSFIVNWLLGDPDEATETFKTISVVDADLAEPDSEVFNSDAINPTIEVYVGNCVDEDNNGVLDEAELVTCGRSTSGANSDDSTEENIEDTTDENVDYFEEDTGDEEVWYDGEE